MKKKNSIFLFCCMVVLMLFKPANCLAQESESPKIEVVIMLDTSYSMSHSIDDSPDNFKINIAKKWAQDLCALFVNTKIIVSIYTFDDVNKEEVQVEKECIDINNGKDILNKLKKIENKESKESRDTDHYGALKKAEGEFGQDADYKYIIILSDGETYYEDDIRNDTETEDDSKKEMNTQEAIENFRTECKEFAKKENQGVILVGFGQQIDMFEELYKNKEDDEDISYIDHNQDPSKITDRFFELLNMPLSLQKESENENGDKTDKIEFRLEKDYYRTIIYIEKKLNKDNIEETQIKLHRGEELVSPEDFEILYLGNSAYVYLESSKAGDYQIIVPEDTWYYKIRNQENGIIKEIRLMLFAKAGDLTYENQENGLTLYTLKENPKELVIKIEFIWENAGNYKSPDNAAVVLAHTSEEEKSEDDWNKGSTRWTDESDGSRTVWSSVLKIPKDNKDNIYQVRVKNGNRNVYSNSIKIERKWPIKTEKELKINEECNLKEIVPEEFVDDINEIEVNIQNKDGYEKYTTRTENTVAFGKAGLYTVDIIYNLEKVGEAELSVIGNTPDWINPFVIAIVVIVVVAITVFAVKKKK